MTLLTPDGQASDEQVNHAAGVVARVTAVTGAQVADGVEETVRVDVAADFTGLSFDFFLCSFDNPESCNVLADIVPYVLAYSVTDQCRPNVLAIPDFIYGGWPEAGIADYTATASAI